MRRYLAGRLLQALVVVFLVATASFFLLHLAPGNPFATDDPRVTPAIAAQLQHQFGLDQPLGVQYARYLANIARGDLGYSFSQHTSVRAALATTLPRTLLLVAIALAVALTLGVALGVYTAARRNRPAARALDAVALVVYSIPDFWLALLALLAFAYWIPLFPSGGMVDPVLHDYLGPWGRALDLLHHLILPAATLALLTTAAVARYQRAALLDVMRLDYIRTARAKGLRERAVLLRHGLRNALVPIITIIGLSLPALVGGAVFVEKVFTWPGMGLLTTTAIAARDYPLVSASMMVGGIVVTLGSLASDLLLAALDPRVRLR